MTLAEAWNVLLEAVPPTWAIGIPEYVPELHQWRIFSCGAHACDEPTDTRIVYADSQVEALVTLANTLRLLMPARVDVGSEKSQPS